MARVAHGERTAAARSAWIWRPCRGITLSLQVRGCSPGSLSASDSGLTLRSAASRRHGAQCYPGAAVGAVLLVCVEHPLEQPCPADAAGPHLVGRDLAFGGVQASSRRAQQVRPPEAARYRACPRCLCGRSTMPAAARSRLSNALTQRPTSTVVNMGSPDVYPTTLSRGVRCRAAQVASADRAILEGREGRADQPDARLGGCRHHLISSPIILKVS